MDQEQVNLVPEAKSEIKGMLLQYQVKMELDGYSAETILGHISCLKALVGREADLNDPESVKLALAKEEKKPVHWSQHRRRNVINAYTLFLKYQNRSWIKPKCSVDEKFPFIPQKRELEDLIAGSYRKLAALLQLLLETAIRCGEAHRIEWTDIDFQSRTIRINHPEKHSNARMFKVSEKLIDMLNNLPRKKKLVFTAQKKSTKVLFERTRKRLAHNLGNPRLLEIHLHTFRHWKGTLLYHETKDIHYVQQFLGHKSVKSTEKYINIEHALFETVAADQKWIVRVSSDPKEITALLEDGFEAHCHQGDLIFLRKRA